MSLYDYQVSKYITDQDYPFYALLLALYRQADTANQEKITRMWPDQVAELHARYNAPGAVLPGESGYDVIMRARTGVLPSLGASRPYTTTYRHEAVSYLVHETGRSKTHAGAVVNRAVRRWLDARQWPPEPFRGSGELADRTWLVSHDSGHWVIRLAGNPPGTDAK